MFFLLRLNCDSQHTTQSLTHFSVNATLRTFILLSHRICCRFHLLGHAIKRLRQLLRHKRQFGLGPDLSIRLQRLLDLGVERAGLERNNLGRRIRVVGNGRAAGWAKDAMHRLARRALAGPRLGLAADFELVLGDDGDEG